MGRLSGITIAAVLFSINANMSTAQVGQRVSTEVTSAALLGNSLGDPVRRELQVYLPPSYDSSIKRYPVVYFLHGGNRDENDFFNLGGKSTFDRLIRNGEASEMIVVGVDGTTASTGQFGGSRFVNSDLYGNYETHIVEEVVNHTDTNFRTIADRDSRGVFGRSMGGFGTLYYAMLHADVFGAAYSHTPGAGCYSHPECNIYLGGDTAVFSEVLQEFVDGDVGENLAGVRQLSDISGIPRGPVYGQAAAFSPNLDKSPLSVDLPFEVPSLTIIPEVRDRWYEYDIFKLLEEHADDLNSLRGLGLDVGGQDQFDLARGAVAFHQALDEAGVPHEFELYAGGHSDKMSARLRVSLAFLSRALVPFGDFDGNGLLDTQDIDQLSTAVRMASHDERFDLNADGMINTVDRTLWLEVADAIPGDANLNDAVEFDDFLALSANFTSTEAGWSQGDFDGDGAVLFFDFLILSQHFGQGTTVSAVVPEPNGLLLLMLACPGLHIFFQVKNG